MLLFLHGVQPNDVKKITPSHLSVFDTGRYKHPRDPFKYAKTTALKDQTSTGINRSNDKNKM